MMERFIEAGGHTDRRSVRASWSKAEGYGHRRSRRPPSGPANSSRAPSTSHQTFMQMDRPRPASRGVPARSSTSLSTPSGRCSACISRCTTAALQGGGFDPNSAALEMERRRRVMDELIAAHQDVKAAACRNVQFGSGALSCSTRQAPPGKHTTYAWHVMPFAPDRGGEDFETFKAEFAEQMIECGRNTRRT